MEIGLIAKAIVFIIAIGAAFFGVKHYGGLREQQGRQKGIQETTEVKDENYTDLADDVLDGGVPWSVQQPGATEITGPEADPEVRVAPDVHRNGGADKSDGDAATTS